MLEPVRFQYLIRIFPLPLVDRDLFGHEFTHLCSLRAIITLLARKMDEQGITPDNAVALQRINQEVALETGHLPKRQRIQ